MTAKDSEAKKLRAKILARFFYEGHAADLDAYGAAVRREALAERDEYTIQVLEAEANDLAGGSPNAAFARGRLRDAIARLRDAWRLQS